MMPRWVKIDGKVEPTESEIQFIFEANKKEQTFSFENCLLSINQAVCITI